MRLVRLDLLAFGRFTDVRLDLGPGFHLVFGPNEAGKSTTLRAIRQLLFGFDERTSDNFVHQNPNLRIGGVVSGIKGHQLEVIRRKTRKDSLLDVTSSLAIDETVWNELLCEIDEATFSSRYGINYAQLIEGGREIATGTGDLGEILFATGSGVMDLAAVQKKLVDDAADLFRPQGKKQRLNQAITEWQERRDLVNQNLLLASEWEEVDRQRRETLVRLESISAELTIRSNEANLCRRLLKAQSSVGELDALIRELNEMPIAHRVPANFSNKRQEAQLLLSNSESLQRKEAVTLAEINSELDQISIPARFIENADELTNVLAEWGSFRKAQLDRTGLVERRDRLISQSKDLLDGILKSTNEGDHNVVEIDRDLRIRIAKLGRDQAGLAKTSQQAETRSQRISDQFVRAQAELAALPVIESIDELRNEYRSARADGDLESRLKNLHDEIASVYQERQSKCELMGISVDSLEAIRKMRLPAAEVIRSWETDFEANRAERSLLRARLTDLEHVYQKLNTQITEFRSNFQIPSESDLTAVRHRRNELFSEIRRIVQANSVPPISLLESYEQSVEEADDYADKLRKETDRVAQLAEQTSELKSNEERQHDLSVRIAELEAGQVERQRLWTEEWKDLRNAPQLPRELQTWLTRRENLIQIDTLLNCRETEANRIGVQIGKRIQSLSKRLFGSTTTTSNSDSQNEPSQSIDQQSREPRSDSSRSQQQLSFGWEIPSLDEVSSDPSSDEVTHSLVDLLTLAEQKIAQHEQLAFARKEAIETIDRLLNEKKESDDQVQSNKVALEEWAKEWQGIMQQLKLPANSPPDTVASYLEATNELSARQRELEQLRERIDGIDADSAQFQAKFESLCRKIAPDLVEIPIAEAMTKVQSRFADFQKARTAKNELTIRKTNAEQQLANATKMRDQAFLIANELYQIVDRSVPESQATGDVTIGSLEIMLKE